MLHIQNHIYNSRKAKGLPVMIEGTNLSELTAARNEIAREIKKRVDDIKREEKERNEKENKPE